jgi:hypothetical protein
MSVVHQLPDVPRDGSTAPATLQRHIAFKTT